MNFRVQLFKTFVTVENSSIAVGRARPLNASLWSGNSVLPHHPQAAAVVHKPATADSQVVHRLKSSQFDSQHAAISRVTPAVVTVIDSVAARFSTTTKFIKL